MKVRDEDFEPGQPAVGRRRRFGMVMKVPMTYEMNGWVKMMARLTDESEATVVRYIIEQWRTGQSRPVSQVYETPADEVVAMLEMAGRGE